MVKILACHPSNDLNLNTFFITNVARGNNLEDCLKVLKLVGMVAVVFRDGDGDDERIRTGSVFFQFVCVLEPDLLKNFLAVLFGVATLCPCDRRNGDGFAVAPYLGLPAGATSVLRSKPPTE
ncbi:hypothetical protein IVB45_04670 [Bradyrhizobium sp. 4]|uniref:hypothetical protein n=1 Tax=unclassified Bradyrhizobium TaxID=2631580 RepID=UPI001FF97828|nr:MULTISPECIES: hypothetical protein [unclassified Bradyrhizobium]MCK1397010.1 hypothetical protein [Bradyrhizobium sp. 39]MCK1630259.1 hypothetical protein [Bradyrhizobium sp. 162]MCK1751368.1 hypothetical protein [Bradyrhizobium sp. 135]UPJ36282.1 hypothetical protein IVB45_04670 [Bradyrhizobium sp. 4]